MLYFKLIACVLYVWPISALFSLINAIVTLMQAPQVFSLLSLSPRLPYASPVILPGA